LQWERRHLSMPYSYERVAGFYDVVARGYSLGCIPAVRALHLTALAKGDRVLYAGVGTGEEATQAAALGARVTAVDLSSRMLDRFGVRLERAGLQAELICQDVRLHGASGYDLVVANFFLNVFDRAEMERVLAHLAARLRPGGELWIADFARPPRGLFRGAFARLYYRPVNLAAWLLGLCSLHPIYDYEPSLSSLGWECVDRLGVPLGFAGGPVCYEALRARRRTGPV